MCSVLFDGPVGKQAPSGDGFVELGELGEEESHLLQKLQEIIRAVPEKAENLYQKFREILEEEEREDLIYSHCPLINHQVEWKDDQLIESGLPRKKRGVQVRKVAKKKKKKVQTKKNQNRYQLGQKSDVATQKRLENGKRKIKISRKSIKSKKERNSSKKKPKSKKSKSKKSKRKKSTGKRQKSKKQAKTTKRRKNLKRRKQEGGRLSITEKEVETTKGLKKGGRERQCDIDCLTNVIFYARLNEKKASVISKQVKRIKGNDDIQNSKGKKKSEFNTVKDRLLSALGGNALNPTCGGQPPNSIPSSSDSNSDFTQETLATLMACEADIEEKCDNRITGDDLKLEDLEACETLADNFKAAFSKCFNASISVEESCACVDKINKSDVASMQKCDVSDDNNIALKAKKSCKAAVGKCKNAAVAAVEGIDTCKEEKNSQAAATTASTTGQIAPCLVVSILLFPMIKVVS